MMYEVLKACQYCGKIHDVTAVCDKKPQPKYYAKRKTRIDKFRSTARWQSVRLEVLERDKNLCRYCFPNAITVRSLEVHHIVPIKEAWDKRDDIDNLVTLCHFHHDLAEQGEISRTELLILAANPPVKI